MPPFIATLLTAVFIAYLFHRDGKQGAAPSGALWIPVCWMSIIGSRFVSQWIDLGHAGVGSDSADGSPIDALYFSCLLAAALVVLHRRGVALGRLAADNKLLALFIAYGLLSVLWSDFPQVAVKRWVKTLGHPLMALIILTDPDPVKAFRHVMKRCAFLLLPISVLFIKYYPEYGRGFDNWTGRPMNNGVGISKNDLGYLCMIFGLFFCWNLAVARTIAEQRERRVEMLLSAGFVGMAAWLLSMADSATSLSTWMLGLATLWVLSWRMVDKNHLAAYLIAALAAAAVAETAFDAYAEIIRLLGRDPSLTDRTAVWADVLALQTQPLTGMGFESFFMGSRLDVMWQKWWWHPNQAHNGYIETYLNLGAIGVALLAGVLLATLRSICRKIAEGDSFAHLRLALLFAILAFNFTEAAFKGVHLVWTMFYIVALEWRPMPSTRPARGATRPSPRALASTPPAPGTQGTAGAPAPAARTQRGKARR